MPRKNTLMIGMLSSIEDVEDSRKIVMDEVRGFEKEGYGLVGPVQVAMNTTLITFAATMTLVGK